MIVSSTAWRQNKIKNSNFKFELSYNSFVLLQIKSTDIMIIIKRNMIIRIRSCHRGMPSPTSVQCITSSKRSHRDHSNPGNFNVDAKHFILLIYYIK